MLSIEFRTQIHNGSIPIPKEFREQMTGTVCVRVILEQNEPDPEENFIQSLMRNPLDIPDFKPMTRDEIYARDT